MVRKNIKFSEAILNDIRKSWAGNNQTSLLDMKPAVALLRAYCLNVHLNMKECSDYILPQNGVAIWWLAKLIENIQSKTMFSPNIYPALAWPWRDGFRVKADLTECERSLVDATSDAILAGDEIAFDASTANIVIVVDDWLDIVKAAKQVGISLAEKFEDAIRPYRIFKDEVMYALIARAKIAMAINARAWRRAKKGQIPKGLIEIPNYLAA
jgi:hypothetical protein